MNGINLITFGRGYQEPGSAFGLLTTLGIPFLLANKRSVREAFVVCSCRCGAISLVRMNALRQQHIVSCGCVRRERMRSLVGDKNPAYRHGGSTRENKTRLYCIWTGMLVRCRNRNRAVWNRYGGRGICVCEAWQSFGAFRDWALANSYRDDLTIDRIDNDGNYEPDNCQWITLSENSRKANSAIGATP